MQKEHSRYNVARIILIFWCLFIGVGALGGSVCMLLKPDGSLMGMQELLPYFQVLPFSETLFQDFVFSGFSLLLVNGIPNLIAAVLLFQKRKSGAVMGGILGLTLMAWICIQFVIFPNNIMDNLYFTFGILQALTGLAALIFYKQEHFIFERGDYPNVDNTSDTLVVYFSRMGYTRKIAYETANRLNAAVYEIKSTETTQGTLGFWWCGRYGMHGWDMPIEALQVDLTAYRKVIICSPIWVFGLAAPMRSFCRMAKGKLQRVDYILIHHMGASFTKVADEMDSLLGLKREHFYSIRCHVGSFRENKQSATISSSVN
ncbi:MAG: hypothetical protein PHI98_07355 [Eubacteriales bacterium]|nr:hypothetical protein [Eubacteriales bacterium]